MEASIITDSVSFDDVRLTTFVLRYPRFIHSELLTHRVFSRNASSSRAIPLVKFIQQVKNDPAIPIHWGRNESGMQASEEIDSDHIETAKNIWVASAESALIYATKLGALGLHKQVVNRILEPYQFISVVLTGTNFLNFFNLRTHEAAQPEIRALALKMQKEYNEHIPTKTDSWHLPFILESEKQLDIEIIKKVSVARCARVSYNNHDNSAPSIEKDQNLYSKLLESKHLSPFEHIACPDDPTKYFGNFRGWKQLRKFIIGESGEFPK